MEKKLSKRLWFNFILFGFMGQVAWNIENMYFNTFLYNSVYAGASQAAVDGSISVMSAISKMVALSAATAVITTFIMGTLSDKMKKRKLFISFGYIAWGIVTAAFGFISKENVAAILGPSADEIRILSTAVWTVIIMDCVMTFMGSTSNDSVFNAWVTDVTNPSNRPKVETVFAALPIVAMGVVMGVGSLAQTGAISYKVFFLSLGAFVMLCGILGLFTLEDPEFTESKETNSSYWSDLFYGFRPSVVKENAGLYLTLVASALYSIAVQVFFPYMLIYIQYVVMPESEGINLMAASSLIPIIIAVVVLVAGLVLLMILAGKKKALAYILGTVCFIVGLTGLGFAKGLVQVALAAAPTLIGYAVLMIQLAASVRDFTPKGKSGLFQGIRMIFNVLLPMVIGPKLGEIASVSSNTTYLDEYGVAQICPTSNMFIYAAVVTVLVLIPLVILIKKGYLKNNAEAVAE